MAELLQKMQERSASAALHFAAIQHDPQPSAGRCPCSPRLYCP